MTKKILKTLGEIEKINSSFGKWAIPVKSKYKYNNGKTREVNEYLYYWNKEEAKEWFNTLQFRVVEMTT